MLKRNTRRVTLSSVDLENFLSEVSISDNQSQARRKTLSFQNNLSENMNKFVIPLNDIENVQPNILKNTNSIQLGSKVEKVSFINQTTTNLIPSQPKVSQEVENKAATEVKDIDCNVALSNEQIVRNYCKNRRNKSYPESDLVLLSMAKELLQKTKYTLFSNRTLFPEKYPYPRGSIEAKRQLLISLSPMLTDAEKSRQKDSTVCERITGCKSVKVKTRYSSYEYTDTATNTVITPEEFEHRYLAYLDQTTPSRVLRLAAIATQASSSDRALATECSSSQSDSTCEDEDVLMFPMDSPPSMNSQPVVIQEVVSDAPLIQNTEDATTDALDTSVCSSISRGHRSRTKRMTLSPKSARDMLLLAASEDEATAETPAVLDTITSSSSSTSPAQADTSVCQSTSAPVPEYSVPASFDPFADEEDTTMNSRAARSKRMTLSPSSARRMLSLSVEEDELNSSSLSECSDSSSSVSLTEAEAVHPVTKPIVVEESVTSPISTSTVVDRDAKVVADFSSELEAILADGPSNDLVSSVKFTVFPRASFSSPAPTPPVIMSVFPDIDVASHSSNTAISPVKSVVGTSLVSPATITTVSSNVKIIAPSIPIIITAANIVPVDTRAPEDFRYEATSRLYARYSQARWRYQWEVVSFEAVVRARDRLFLRFASKN